MRTVTRADQLAGQGGNKVRLVGIYRRWIAEDETGRSYRFTGYAVVELDDGGSVQIGEAHRAREEVDHCVGRRVAVTGVIDVARPDPLPVLLRPGPVLLL
jgi:hypothetical protein